MRGGGSTRQAVSQSEARAPSPLGPLKGQMARGEANSAPRTPSRPDDQGHWNVACQPLQTRLYVAVRWRLCIAPGTA